MKDIPSIFFVRHFISLFTEIKNETIRIAIFDLLILLGSGHDSKTLLGQGSCLCRTSQLMLSISLAMLRIVIYDTETSASCDWTIQDLSDRIDACVTDPVRLLNETLQLESYIFTDANSLVKSQSDSKV